MVKAKGKKYRIMARFLPKGKFVTLMPPDPKNPTKVNFGGNVLTTKKKATAFVAERRSDMKKGRGLSSMLPPHRRPVYKAVRDPPPTYKSNGTTFIWSSKSDSYRRKAKRKQKGRK
jgi:hypothetical protein